MQKINSLSYDKHAKQFMTNTHTKSPILGHRPKKLANNVMSQSVDHFEQFQPRYYDQPKYYPQQVDQSFDPHQYNTIQGQNNFWYNEIPESIPDMRNTAGFGMMHPGGNGGGVDIRQNYNMNNSVRYNQGVPMQSMTATGYYNDPRMNMSNSYFNSPNRDSHFQQAHHESIDENKPDGLYPRPLHTDRQYNNNNQKWMSKMNRDYNIPQAPFGFKKGDSPVQKFRRKNILRNKSKVIKISGVNKDITTELYNLLQNIGDIIELKTKWVNRGDMQVKFKDEKSAKKAMDKLDGMVINGCKLQVTQVFPIFASLNAKNKAGFHQTKLGLIKESEDSDEPDRGSSEDDKSSLQKIEETENESFEQIEKNITDIIDTNEDETEDEKDRQFNSNPVINNGQGELILCINSFHYRSK